MSTGRKSATRSTRLGTARRLILSPPGSDDIIQLLRAWRFWVLGAVLGALLGAALFIVDPPPYRARATVNVDFHLEQAWPEETDRQQFYYLERETRKLVDIATSDATMAEVAGRVPGVTVASLRTDILRLTQPGSGGWHFYADHHDPGRAADLASAWAQAFKLQVEQEVVAGAAGGLEPFITVFVVQTEDLVAEHAQSVSLYMAAGALAFLALSALGLLFFRFPS
jgi:hypothetical protein